MANVRDNAVTHCTHLRVRYADTDQMQVVYNGKYLEYFEVGRTELLRACGLPYVQLEAAGVRLPLVESHCRYHLPARYDDMLLVHATVHDFRSPRLRIEYEIRRESDSSLVVSGSTVHCFQDVSSGRPMRPHPLFVETLASFILQSAKQEVA